MKQINSYSKSHQNEETFDKQKSNQIQVKKLTELININRSKEENITQLQIELQKLKSTSIHLDQQIQNSEAHLEQLIKQNQQEQKNQGEQENQMNNWIEQVQKYNGLPQSSIDMLISMEYQANPLQPEICFACYKQMKSGQMCKYLPCFHIFHQNCANQHLKISRVCPACMEEVNV